MNKYVFLAGVATTFFAFNAQAVEIKPVVGLDYVYSIADISGVTLVSEKVEEDISNFFEDNLHAFAISAGVKLNEYVGLEAFYQQSEKADKKYLEDLKFEDEYKAYGLDVIGYLPVAPQLDLIGSLGMAYYKFEGKISFEDPSTGGSASDSEDKLGFRTGAGLQYNITDHVSARFMAKYNYTNIDEVENIVDITAGVRFYF